MPSLGFRGVLKRAALFVLRACRFFLPVAVFSRVRIGAVEFTHHPPQEKKGVFVSFNLILYQINEKDSA